MAAAARLADAVQKQPLATACACFALCMAVAAGIGGLHFNANYKAYFDEDDAFLETHRRLVREFAQHDSVVVALEFERGQALTPGPLGLVAELVEQIRSLPNVSRVHTVFDLVGQLDTESPNELVEFETNETEQLIAHRDRLLADPRGHGLTIAEDESALLIEVVYALADDAGADELVSTLEKLRETVAQATAMSRLDPDIHYSGALALNESYVKVVRHDLAVFLPVFVSLLFLLLALFFRSANTAGLLIFVAALAVVSGFGIAGWLGLELAAINAFAPVIIASLTLAGGVHMAYVFAMARRAGASDSQALIGTIDENAVPLTLTSATTALGFLALATSPSPPVRVIGYIVAAGVVSGWFYNLVLLPLLLTITGHFTRTAALRQIPLQGLAKLAAQKPRTILAPFFVLLVASLLLVRGNEVNDNVFEYFPPEHELRQDTSFLQQRFSGINRITYSIGTDDAYGAFDSTLLQRLGDFASWARSQPEVRRVLTLTDIERFQKRLGDLTDGRPLERYRRLAQNYAPTDLGIEQLVDEDFSELAVHIYLAELDANAITDFNARANEWLKAHGPPYLFRGGGGSSLVFAHLGQRNARSMLYSLGAALVVISILCALVVRSWDGAWIGLACNTFPVLLVYAAWAVANGKISLGGAVVIGMIMGIVVDDSLYLLTKYARLKRSGNKQPALGAVTAVGPALVVTSVSLCVGLSTGLLSDFEPIVSMSVLSIGIIAAALGTDLLVLPALLALRYGQLNEADKARP